MQDQKQKRKLLVWKAWVLLEEAEVTAQLVNQ